MLTLVSYPVIFMECPLLELQAGSPMQSYLHDSNLLQVPVVINVASKCIHGVSPPYLQEYCVPAEKVQGRPRLRSASTGCVWSANRRRWTSAASPSTAGQPTGWNLLPPAARDGSPSLNTFQWRKNSVVWTVMNATRRRCGVSLWFWRRI